MRPLGDRISEGRRGVRGFGSCRMNCRSGLLLPGTGSRCPHQIFVLQEQFLVNRTGDVRQHSFPIHRGELTETTACAQPPVRPANPWTWVRPSFCTIREAIVKELTTATTRQGGKVNDIQIRHDSLVVWVQAHVTFAEDEPLRRVHCSLTIIETEMQRSFPEVQTLLHPEPEDRAEVTQTTGA